jgi:hypothetical protein
LEADTGEAVPVTVWPIRSGPATLARPEVHASTGWLPVDAVIAQVRACYPVPGRWVVVDGDNVAAPEQTGAVAAPAPLDLIVAVARSRASTGLETNAGSVAPGGLLVIVLPASLTVDLSAVVAWARAAGLRYLQHNVVFPVPLACANSPGVARRTRRHARIHADVLAFQRPSH